MSEPTFIVTGGAGFIGCNIVAALNARGHTDIEIVDNLKLTRMLSIMHRKPCINVYI